MLAIGREQRRQQRHDSIMTSRDLYGDTVPSGWEKCSIAQTNERTNERTDVEKTDV